MLNKLKNMWNLHAGQLVKRSDLYYTAAVIWAIHLALNNL